MNFNIHLNKKTLDRISRIAKTEQRSQNSIISEAVEAWLKKYDQPTTWPPGFFEFDPIDDLPDFEALRKDLKDNVKEDPLA